MMSNGTLDRFVEGLDYPMFIVTVATDDGARAGCLIGFATQCSIDPPRLLVCLSKKNHTYRLACTASTLAVHRLDPAQQELAELFGSTTGDTVDKFAHCAWRPGPAGVPVLADCPGHVVGNVLDRFDLGDHVGFLLAPLAATGPGGGRALSFSGVQGLEPGHEA
jgi:flavin reductase (DIM6/NTAB) family NADH-FMN oxidoreductase RutF